jgi:hypothetical protein
VTVDPAADWFVQPSGQGDVSSPTYSSLFGEPSPDSAPRPASRWW